VLKHLTAVYKTTGTPLNVELKQFIANNSHFLSYVLKGREAKGVRVLCFLVYSSLM
jgi:hypothetical protein